MDYRIDWVDRETLAFRIQALSVYVWVDYEDRFFSRGRVIHMESIQRWVDADSRIVRNVTEDEREFIAAAIQRHYAEETRSCRVAP